jgi:hypothetical protein
MRNMRQIALKWKTARGDHAEEDCNGRRPWQTNVQLLSAKALDESRQSFLDGNRNNGGPGKVGTPTSCARHPRNALDESEV